MHPHLTYTTYITYITYPRTEIRKLFIQPFHLEHLLWTDKICAAGLCFVSIPRDLVLNTSTPARRSFQKSSQGILKQCSENSLRPKL